MSQAGSAIIVPSRQGRALWHLGALMTFKALTAETDGQFWALEGFADRQMAVPLHVHSHEDELWYILEGEIAFVVGEETVIGTAGTMAYIPRGVAHTFQVRSETARWFGIGFSGRLDNWFFETGEPAGALTLPPPTSGPPTEAEIGAIVASLQAYGTETVGPPPAPA